MTTKQKIAVSLPPQLVLAAKKAVRTGHAPNVSAYVADALANKVMLDDLSALLEEMLAETGGPLTMKERHRADRILRGSRTRKR